VNTQNPPQHSGQALLPQLDAAYNLARWLVRDAALADDAVREAYSRAARSFASPSRPSHASGRAWLLGFVRESCHARLGADSAEAPRSTGPAIAVDDALAALPVAWRECIVLRDIEGLSYADLAQIIDIPVGTVMARLVDARRALRQGCAIDASARPHELAAVDH
jgi:RNA polymerase sigma-70 factor, ECF subfamily